MNFFEIVFLFFAFNAFLLAFLFFLKKKGDRVANRLLGVYIFLFGYNIAYNVLYWSAYLHTKPYLALIFTNLIPWVLYGPILYLYLKRVTNKGRFQIVDLLHFIPFLYVVINNSPGYFMSIDQKIELLVSGRWKELMYYFNPYRIKIVIGLMFVYCALILFSFKKDIKSFNNSRWLNWLTFSFLGYVLSFSSFFILVYFGFIGRGYDYFIGFSMVFFIALLSYFGFLQPQVFDGLSMDRILPFKKYEKTGLTKDHSLELRDKLLEYVNNEKPYLNSELRLDTLANKLNLSRHHMSQVINEHFDLRFFDFINKYRIEEAKKLLGDETLNITDVLYECGFNNRVSFYKAFKRYSGITPTEYKSRLDKSPVNL